MSPRAVPASRCHNPEIHISPTLPSHGAGGLRRPRATTTTEAEDSKDKEKKSKEKEERHEKNTKKSTKEAREKAQREQTKSPDGEEWSYKREYTPPLSLKSSPKGLAVPRWQMGFERWISR